ncbi:hypothetical protein EVJ58_g9570 [Rhodofomes roseus]|uniref:Mixed lineage kinase domain-containing protein n=1 Tax=Rhodofomes roseus TaxID=34475 RepID=A0A4Y9XTX8_9APHY|nr:hypothetical protein EVJ58_g9570 [Rhodofomes roseus]
MPLRYIRRKITANDVITVAVATTAAATSLAGAAGFPPVAIPAAILLKIFQTIQDVKTKQEECYDLAFRCLSFLDLMKDQLLDHNREVPPSLLDALTNFARTLESIHSFLVSQAESKWRTRLLRKGSIEIALSVLNTELNDAINAFQIATLINIHYTIGDRLVIGSSSKERFGGEAQVDAYDTDDETVCSSALSQNHLNRTGRRSRRKTTNELTLVYEPAVDTHVLNAPEEELEEFEDHGFRRYQESDIKTNGSSRIKGGWWAGDTQADVKGRYLLVKSYDGPRYAASKVAGTISYEAEHALMVRQKWIRDVKILQNVFHPNLPQMVGFSSEECPTPFILLANVQTRLPQALVLDTIQHGTLAECVILISRFYLDHMDAALYLQRQLHLSDSKIQDYVENASYRIDGQRILVMGLPPPEVDRWASARNYDLSHSVRGVYLDLLPSRGMVPEKPYETSEAPSLETQKKINHLTHALNAVLPSSHSTTQISELNELLSACEDDSESTSQPIHLRRISGIALSLGASPPVWREKLVPAYKYSVGDLGYLAKQGDFASFKLICNVIRNGHASLQAIQSQHGTQIQWHRGPPIQTPLDSFPCPGNRVGWAVVIEPNTDYNVVIAHEERVEPMIPAGRFLLDYGQHLSKIHGVQPDDLMLITRVGVDFRFRLKGPFAPFMNPHQSPAFHQHGFRHHSHTASKSHARFGGGGLGHHSSHMSHGFGLPLTPPTILYLSTSIDKGNPPTWSQSPVFDLQSAPPHNIANCMIGSDPPLGYLNYVQFHAEDFLGAGGEPLKLPPPRPKEKQERAKVAKTYARAARTGC